MAVEFHPNDTPAERVARFISDRGFELRRCQRYVKNNFGKGRQFFKEDDCACGQPVTWHLKHNAFHKASVLKADDWSVNKDTVPYPCDTFGELAFRPGFGVDQSLIVPGAVAKYVRVERRAHNSEQYMENIFTLMTDRNLWNMPVPQLIIEVTGSAYPLPHVDQRAIERFNAGIVTAAKSANAWIVTGGTNCGVMQLVGEAVTKARMTHVDKVIPCVGIVSWGVVKHREHLIGSVDEQMEGRSPMLNNGSSPRNGNSNYLSVNMAVGRERRTSTNSANSSLEINGKWPADYIVERREKGEEPALDPGHTAFLLVDNGREKQFGEEIMFRAQFLHFLSKKSIKASISDSGMAVTRTPLVLLVIGGGPKTLETVQISTAPIGGEEAVATETKHTKKRRKSSTKTESSAPPPKPKDDSDESWPRPVVIIPGFGGAADVLAFAYTITSPTQDHDWKLYRTSAAAIKDENETTDLPLDFDDRVKKHPAFKSLFPPTPTKTVDEMTDDILDSIKACLQKRHLLTIFNLFDEHDDSNKSTLDHAILNAIFKSDLQSDPSTTFLLAQLWKRCDVAKRIFKQHPEEIRKSVDLKVAMTRAIEMGDSSFFEFFIEYGLVNLDSYLTLTQMRNFYEDLFIKKVGKAAKVSCIQLFRSLLMNGTTEETLSDLNNPKFLENVGEVLASLLQCYIDNTFTGEKQRQRMIFSNAEEAQESMENDQRRSSFSSTNNLRFTLAYDTSQRDLFILLLLLNRREMALKLWKLGHDHLGSAIMASIFLKSLSKEAVRLDMMDLGTSYEEHASNWQERALELLDYCYDQEPLRCNRLLSRSLLMWQGLTVLEMAYYGKKKKIMEHAAFQTKLAQIWLGRMATFTKSSLIYLTMFPPLLPFLIFRIRFEESTVFMRSPAETQAINALMTSSASTATAMALPGVAGHQTAASLRRYSIMPPQRQDLEAAQMKDGESSKCGKGCLGRISPESSNNERPIKSRFSSQKYNDKKLLKASLTKSHDQTQTISVFKAIFFLYASPIVKFITHALALFTFLFIFTAFILISPNPHKVTALEIVIWVTCSIYFFDLLREGFGKKNLTFQEKLEDFFSDVWNCSDILGLCLVIASVILRFTVPASDFIYPRTTYSLACVVYWVKSLHIFYVTKLLGPKVATLFKMLRDLAFFVLLYVLILLAFAAPIYTLLWPNAKISTGTEFLAVLLDVAFNRMWNLFAINLEDGKKFAVGTCSAKPGEKSFFGELLSNSSTTKEGLEEAVMTTTGSLLSSSAGGIRHERSVEEGEEQPSASSLVNSTLNFLVSATTAAILEAAGGSESSNKSRLEKSLLEHTKRTSEEHFTKEAAEAVGGGEEEPCSERNIIAIILYIIYLLLTNIVLLNMLVAMFAHTVDETRISAERLWRFNMFRFVHEYYKKPVLPGPLMAFELLFRIGRTLQGTKNHLPPNNDFKEFYYSIEDFEYRKLEMFERSAVETMMIEMRENGKGGGGNSNVVVTKLRHVHDKLASKIEHMEDKLHDFRSTVLKQLPSTQEEDNDE